MELPAGIRRVIGDRPFTVDTIGKSGSLVILFEDMVLKVERRGAEADQECRMMAWLAGRLPVPEVLTMERAGNANYLLMSRLEGEMCCASGLLDHPEELVELLAEGLRTLWRVDTKECPCRGDIGQKLALAAYRVSHHLCDTENVEPGTYGPEGFEDPGALLRWLEEHRPEREELVFSHGDLCLPNLFVKDSRISGFIDLGRSGTADRYQDLALCWRSLRDNLGGRYGGRAREGFDPGALFAALGLEPDWDRLRYYLLLDELF